MPTAIPWIILATAKLPYLHRPYNWVESWSRGCETGEYAPISYGRLLYEIEAQQLQEVIAALRVFPWCVNGMYAAKLAASTALPARRN